MKNIPFRWIVAGVFMISSALNYLDRQILAAVAPLIIAEFQLNNQGYGWILSVFSITYAISSPIAGLVLDRYGLTRGISAAVALWSAAGIGTGLVGFGLSAAALFDSMHGMFWTNVALVPLLLFWLFATAIDAKKRMISNNLQ